MEKNLETTVTYWGYIRRAENKMETTIFYGLGFRHFLKYSCLPRAWYYKKKDRMLEPELLKTDKVSGFGLRDFTRVFIDNKISSG